MIPKVPEILEVEPDLWSTGGYFPSEADVPKYITLHLSKTFCCSSKVGVQALTNPEIGPCILMVRSTFRISPLHLPSESEEVEQLECWKPEGHWCWRTPGQYLSTMIEVWHRRQRNTSEIYQRSLSRKVKEKRRSERFFSNSARDHKEKRKLVAYSYSSRSIKAKRFDDS